MDFEWLSYTSIGLFLVKITILVNDIDNAGGYPYGGPGSTWEISVLSSQFCYKPKTSLKNYHKSKTN